MATIYRRISAPTAPALAYRDFSTYSEALAYSRSIGAHKPLRLDLGARWRVCHVNREALQARPVYAKLPAWQAPRVCPSVLAPVCDRLAPALNSQA